MNRHECSQLNISFFAFFVYFILILRGLRQMIWKLKPLGGGNFSRQDAKSPSLQGIWKLLQIIFTLDLRPLRPLRLCRRYSEIPSRFCRTGLWVVCLNPPPLSCRDRAHSPAPTFHRRG